MVTDRSCCTILLADDDRYVHDLARKALAEVTQRQLTKIVAVDDGIQLLDYLYRRGKFGRPNSAPRPRLILLDLKYAA